MRHLTLPPGFPLPGLDCDVAEGDTMHAGSGVHYLKVGLEALHLVEAAIGNGLGPRQILDLPCGHGRVTRFLRARFPATGITVCDVDRGGVDFSATQFRARPVHTSGDFRPLQLGGPYDLVWIGSLVTHLPATETRRLLDCMVRHMAPGAVLVLTSHGAHVAERIAAGATYGLPIATARAVLREHETGGYGFRNYPGGNGYGISLVSRVWYEAVLEGSPLRLHSYRERAWDDHQDVLVLRPAAPRLRRLVATLVRRARFGQDCARSWFEATDTGRDRHVVTAEEHVVTTEEADAATIVEPPPTKPPDFDEAWYVRRYSDVGEAVARGDFSSGLDHYLRYGRHEGRAVAPIDVPPAET